ncbi:MAG: DNA-binding response regulator [Candidatus Dadabacteria bacterium]|nr:MAG: DNA-binding response regulator [Candidatus Dadabacteria bacterium]
MIQPNETVYVVDDDQGMRQSLSYLLESVGLRVETFADGNEFLERFDPDRAGCLILDVRMPGRSGPELQDTLVSLGIDIPIIMITAYGDVPTSTRAMRQGAIDFLEKPFSEQDLLARVNEALAEGRERRRLAEERSRLAARMARLTPREREVLDGVVAGKHNKLIAAELGISPKTVESHRARVMAKLGASSAAELVRFVCAYEQAFGRVVAGD